MRRTSGEPVEKHPEFAELAADLCRNCHYWVRPWRHGKTVEVRPVFPFASKIIKPLPVVSDREDPQELATSQPQMITSVAQPKPIDLLGGSPFVSYVYSYPHKTAYRPLPAQPLSDVWQQERKAALFLYLHIPFCEYRCGFCNLFTLTQPGAELPQQYLSTLRKQATAVKAQLDGTGEASSFARMAIGGGTPTFLTLPELEELFQIIRDLGAEPTQIPVSCEASPATLDLEKLLYLREQGVERLSLGVQSFDGKDVGKMGRPQKPAEVHAALELIKQVGFPTLNIDLIYGGEGQTIASWLESIETALRYEPEELYLYPIYVRPLTGLGSRGRDWDDFRLEAYRAGRDLLQAHGYQQCSLRMFEKRFTNPPTNAPVSLPGSPSETSGPVYCCQQDGMIGLGCGARSYTRSLHYSSEYAVGSKAVAGILANYMQKEESDFAVADFGYDLTPEDQRRRHLILSLLQTAGASRRHYQERFESDLLADFPQLSQLLTWQLASVDDQRVWLTPAGMERSDAIGPWLFSERVQTRMADYAWR